MKERMTSTMKNGLRSSLALLRRCGCVPVKGHYWQGYRYNGGFFLSPRNELWYWMAGDSRFFPECLIRRANGVEDFEGGTNNYPRTENEVKVLLESEIEYDGKCMFPF